MVIVAIVAIEVNAGVVAHRFQRRRSSTGFKK